MNPYRNADREQEPRASAYAPTMLWEGPLFPDASKDEARAKHRIRVVRTFRQNGDRIEQINKVEIMTARSALGEPRWEAVSGNAYESALSALARGFG